MKVPFLIYSSRQQQHKWTAASDAEVMAAVQADDEQAFDELIRRKTAPLLQAVGRITRDREEARDIVQVVFLRVWEKRQRFDSRWSPNTWIFRIAVNLAIDQVRWRQTREQAARPLGSHLRSIRVQGERTLADLEHREVSDILENLSTCLTERQRLVLLLAGVEGLGSEDVGQILDCKASTVRNHLFAARKHLRLELARQYPEYVPGARGASDQEGEK
jgi:RNA polymerase sigma-70 factor (ECF subfamily)